MDDLDIKVLPHELFEELKNSLFKAGVNRLIETHPGWTKELWSLALQIGTFHVEAGSREQDVFFEKLIEDLGEDSKLYFKPIFFESIMVFRGFKLAESAFSKIEQSVNALPIGLSVNTMICDLVNLRIDNFILRQQLIEEKRDLSGIKKLINNKKGFSVQEISKRVVLVRKIRDLKRIDYNEICKILK